MTTMNGEVVVIDSLTPHPGNPRRGDVEAIKDSLQRNGQYQPIVVDAGNVILAGNHTWLAAQELGWTEITVVRLDVDQDTAARIVLTDNRTSDLAAYDDGALLELLSGLGDLGGTGWEDEDLNDLRFMLEEEMDLSDLPVPPRPPAPPHPADDEGDDKPRAEQITTATLVIPGCEPLGLSVEEAACVVRTVKGIDQPVDDVLRTLLALPPRGRQSRSVGRLGGRREDPIVSEEVDEVPIDSVAPHPANPRQGDVGAIAKSLGEFGQYRPIVVNRRDNAILAGSHRWMAGRALNWKTIGVVWVDVDDEAARKILAADNRTADLGRYDEAQLLEMLQMVGSLEGTGYELEDLDDLWARVAAQRNTKQAQISLVVPSEDVRWAVRESWRRYDTWLGRLRAEASDGNPALVALRRLCPQREMFDSEASGE